MYKLFHPLFHLFFQKTRLLNKELNAVLKSYHLFSSQWTIIFCVEKHGEMSLTEIWKYLNVEAPTITRTVNRLCELGWLTVVPSEDKREKIVKLSDEGLERYPEIATTIQRFEQEYLQAFTPEECEQLMQLLNKVNFQSEQNSI